jgi:hypothetical protein
MKTVMFADELAAFIFVCSRGFGDQSVVGELR